MTSKLWLTVPTVNVEISLLVPSQLHLSDDWKPGQSYSNDPFPHVVYFEGLHRIVDGHNRIAFTQKQGKQFIEVRLIYKVAGQILVPLKSVA